MSVTFPSAAASLLSSSDAPSQDRLSSAFTISIGVLRPEDTEMGEDCEVVVGGVGVARFDTGKGRRVVGGGGTARLALADATALR